MVLTSIFREESFLKGFILQPLKVVTDAGIEEILSYLWFYH